MYIYRHFRRWN